MKRSIGVVLVLLSLVALGLQWKRAERRLESSFLVWSVQQRGQAVSAGQAPGRVLLGAIPMIQQANELDPVSIEAAASAADLFFLLGRDETARELYREALALEARPELYLNLGILDLRLGDRARGLKYLESARRLDRRLVKSANEAEQKYREQKNLEPREIDEPSSDSTRRQDSSDGPDEDR